MTIHTLIPCISEFLLNGFLCRIYSFPDIANHHGIGLLVRKAWRQLQNGREIESEPVHSYERRFVKELEELQVERVSSI